MYKNLLKEKKNLTLTLLVFLLLIIYLSVILFSGDSDGKKEFITMSELERNIEIEQSDIVDIQKTSDSYYEEKQGEDKGIKFKPSKIDDKLGTIKVIPLKPEVSAKSKKQKPVEIVKNKFAYLKKPITTKDKELIKLDQKGLKASDEKERSEKIENKKTEKAAIAEQPISDILKQNLPVPENDYPVVTSVTKPKHVQYQKAASKVAGKKLFKSVSHTKHGNIMLYSKPKYSFYTIRMYNLNTEEKLSTIFYQNGEYSVEGMKQVSNFLRDYRTGDVINIDPKLMMLVYRISRTLKYNGHIEVISGYRSVKTNNRLRKIGRKVAKNSMHSVGKAIDIRVPGVSTKRLRDIAKSFRSGGVGYYPKDGFVHIDTGVIRSW